MQCLYKAEEVAQLFGFELGQAVEVSLSVLADLAVRCLKMEDKRSSAPNVSTKLIEARSALDSVCKGYGDAWQDIIVESCIQDYQKETAGRKKLRGFRTDVQSVELPVARPVLECLNSKRSVDAVLRESALVNPEGVPMSDLIQLCLSKMDGDKRQTVISLREARKILGDHGDRFQEELLLQLL